MYAYIETGGKQFKVSAGDTINAPYINAEPGTEITIDKVLVVVNEGAVTCGKPYVETVSVTAIVGEAGRDKKVIVFHKLPRKNHRKRRGHRQDFTKLTIKEIRGA